MTPVSHGKPCAGNPHARFEEGASAPESPRRNALLHSTKNDVGHGHAVLDVSSIREVLGEHVQFVYRNHIVGCSSARFNCMCAELSDVYPTLKTLNVNVIIWGLPDAWFDYAQKCENATGRHYRDTAMPLSFKSLEEWFVRHRLYGEGPEIGDLQDYLFYYTGLLVDTPKVNWLVICDSGVCVLDVADNRPRVLPWCECERIHIEDDFVIFSAGKNDVRTYLAAKQFLDGTRLKIIQSIMQLSSLWKSRYCEHVHGGATVSQRSNT